MGGLLIAGTTSDAGKTVVTTGLCQALARRGVKVGAVQGAEHVQQFDGVRRPDGASAEIGRAQWIHACTARVAPEPVMNPVLLKPGYDRRSHLVVVGRPAGEVAASGWLDGRRALADAAHDATLA